ncbi:MAG: type III-B CRISPR module-associated protein Cmr5 [Deltaproteobacteria bacterium]|nr:type III-B CRISPR module-associated protein Cmr5 [Deltaproteobacteria bacterium]
MRTKEQTRSEYALRAIDDKFPRGVDKDTANFIVGVPTMILTNGVAQTLAFLLSKRDSAKHSSTFSIIRSWLEKEIPLLKADKDMLFLQKFAGLEQGDYLTAQREALAMLQWLKRYARAFEV